MRSDKSVARRSPRRLAFGRWRGWPFASIPPSALEEHAAFLPRGPVRDSLIAELRLRAGSDRDPAGELLRSAEELERLR